MYNEVREREADRGTRREVPIVQSEIVMVEKRRARAARRDYMQRSQACELTTTNVLPRRSFFLLPSVIRLLPTCFGLEFLSDHGKPNLRWKGELGGIVPKAEAG